MTSEAITKNDLKAVLDAVLPPQDITLKTLNGNSLKGSGNIVLSDLGVHISTSEPTSADGNDGDIWLVYSV